MGDECCGNDESSRPKEGVRRVRLESIGVVPEVGSCGDVVEFRFNV